MSESLIDLLFNCISPLCDFHTAFLKQLEHRLTSWWVHLFCMRCVKLPLFKPLLIDWSLSLLLFISSTWFPAVLDKKNTHTHTNPFNGLCPGLPGWVSTRKVKPIWILLKQKTVSGSGIRWAICKSAPRSRQITMLAPHRSVFYRPYALPATQPTVSKHWDKKNCCTKTALIYKDKFYTTPWVKKNRHQTVGHNFTNYYPIFNFFFQ